jgi:2-alkyl-3-oxoalkanoate reductase
MKVFVTGATGVIGRRAVPLLLKAGHEVNAGVRSAGHMAPLARLGARPLVVDLFDGPALERALAGHDAVINLATHMPGSMLRALLPGAWRENDRLRRDASRILVDAALAQRVGRFVQESFAPVYPDRGDAWIDEDVPIEPTRYNRTVADAEASARRFAGTDGGAGVVLRFAAFYGPDAFQSLTMIEAVRKGFAPLPGRPDAFYSSVSHDDAAAAVVAALGLPAGAYNVADDEPLRRRDMANVIAAGLGVAAPRPLPGWVAKLAGSLGELMSRSVRISNRKLRTASGWAPRWPSLREGWPAMLQATQPGAEPATARRSNASRDPSKI